VFDLSRSYGGGGGYAVRIDFAPGYSEDAVAELLAADRAAGLSGIVHARIAEVFGEGGSAALVKRFVVPVKGTKGWKEAQITAGGVSLDEVDPKHFESKAVPGVYFVGAILDYDGPSGGFNLDYAWNTGLKAGRAAGAYCSSYLSEL
jgi:hypothetical protein